MPYARSHYAGLFPVEEYRMDNSSIIPYLFGVTLLIALGVGIYQFYRAKKALRTHERSASAVANQEPRTPAPRNDRGLPSDARTDQPS
jgi:hypothetical protein